MRAAAVGMLLVAACSFGGGGDGSGSTGAPDDAGASVDAGPSPDAAVPADAGSQPDAGPAADGGSQPDAGVPRDGGPAPDAGGPPPQIGSAPCPAQPPLLWSRTFSDEVDFRGAADEDGNVYWVEYDPPPTSQNPDAPPWLASADLDGKDRYRVPISVAAEDGVFAVAGSKVLLSKASVLAAYDSASGTHSWSFDIGEPNRIDRVVDLGGGKLAFSTTYSSSMPNGLYVVDAMTGAISWSGVNLAYRVSGSDGAGSALAIGSRLSGTAGAAFAFDSSGRQLWSAVLPQPREFLDPVLLAWSSGPPWLPVGVQADVLAPAGNFVAVPADWAAAVDGPALGFAVSFAGTAGTPVSIDVVRDGAVVAKGPIPGTTVYDGASTLPFLAGVAGDHLLLLWQKQHSNPGLCHVVAFGDAALSRYDAASSYHCPFNFHGESAIEGAALLDGRLVLGRRTFLTDACTQQVQPVTIEAYGLPGESLAPSGWVQRGGSPGLGLRPRSR